jgi:mannose-6-phosphate isomerase-like protein (cupin superfamily)
MEKLARYEIADFSQIAGVRCPCGTARRAFADVPDYPATVHVTEISADAELHYHKRLTETYYILECGADAKMQLDDDIIPLRAGLCILIRPGVRHRAIGQMKVLIVAMPKFDPEDEWMD